MNISLSDDDNLITLTTPDGYKPTNTYINSGFVDVRSEKWQISVVNCYLHHHSGILSCKEIYSYTRYIKIL